MIPLILSLFISSAGFANGGTDTGGGGHPCKIDFMDTYTALKADAKKNLTEPEHLEILKEIDRVVNPTINPSFRIDVTDTEIKNCPHTEKPIACSYPRENRLQLYCGQSGWTSLANRYVKYKHVIHELLWWSKKYNDANYYYSTSVINALRGMTNPLDCPEIEGRYLCTLQEANQPNRRYAKVITKSIHQGETMYTVYNSNKYVLPEKMEFIPRAKPSHDDDSGKERQFTTCENQQMTSIIRFNDISFLDHKYNYLMQNSKTLFETFQVLFEEKRSTCIRQ